MCDSNSSPEISDLVRQHHVLLYRYAYRLSGSAADAEDLTQETYLIACRRLEQLREHDRAKSWLCTILRNTYLKRLRDTNQVKLDTPAMEAIPAAVTQTRMPLGIDSERLQAALGELPESFRTPLILYYFEEFSYKEIAEQMDVPIGTIMSRLARAKAHLRQQLGETDSDDKSETGRRIVIGPD